MADLVPSPPSPGGANGGGGDDGSTSTAVISFLASLAIQTVVLVACLLTFEFLRRVYPAFYSARLMFGPSGPGSKKPRALRNGFLAWIPQVWTVPDSEIQQVAGMDAVAYLRTHKFGGSLAPSSAVPQTCKELDGANERRPREPRRGAEFGAEFPRQQALGVGNRPARVPPVISWAEQPLVDGCPPAGRRPPLLPGLLLVADYCRMAAVHLQASSFSSESS